MSVTKKLLLVFINYWTLFFVCVGGVGVYYSQFSMAATFLLGLAYLYLAPPLICRFLFVVFGKPRANAAFGSREFFVWWFTLQLQNIFIRLPFLEEVLRMVPGLYSTWLRLWGAKIGRLVFWSAGVTILDRPFVKVGDGVVFGFATGVSSHIWTQGPGGKQEFIFAEVTIEDHAVLGARASITPGSRVENHAVLPVMKVLKPFQKWPCSKNA